MKQSTKTLLFGLAITWWAVISIIIGSIIRIEYLPAEYYNAFNFAAVVYGCGWFISIFAFTSMRSIDNN